MSEGIKSKFTTYVEQVKNGAKPVALMSLQARYIDEAEQFVKERTNLNVYIENIDGYDEWKNVYIYKHDFMLEIIKKMPEKPNSIYDHWVLGKLFGYSDEAIKEFVERKN